MPILVVNESHSFRLIYERTTALIGMEQPIELVTSIADVMQIMNRYHVGIKGNKNILFLDLKTHTEKGLEFVEAISSADDGYNEKLVLVIHFPGFTRVDVDRLEKLSMRFCLNRPPSDEDMRFIVFS